MLKLQIPINSAGDVFEYVLDSAEVTVGRRHDNDIRIKETYVSAYHAAVIRGGDGSYFLRDRDSSNGTFHNGKRVTRQVAVSEGDSLKFGKLECCVVKAKILDNRSIASAGSMLMEKARHLPLKEVLKSAAFSKGRKESDPELNRELESSSDSKTELVTPPASTGQGVNHAKPEVNRAKPEVNRAKPEVNRAKPEVKGDGSDLLKIEIDSLSRQLQSNQAELDHVRKMSARLSEELSDERQRTRKLESAIKIKETENNRLFRELRSEKIRADEKEDDLVRARSQAASELQGVLAQLEVAKNDNHLLQGTLEVLEAEHKKNTQNSFDFAEKLKTTREGFSPNRKRSDEEPTGLVPQALDRKRPHDEVHAQVANLETELSAMRNEFQEMESNYKERIKLSSAAQSEATRAASNLERELAKTRAQLNVQPGSGGNRGGIEALNPAGEAELDILRKSKATLEKEIENLHVENKFLVAKVERSNQENEAREALSEKNRTELEESAHKLEEILQKLNSSEKRVKDLRRLESELEKSVQRAQRSALSRKGIYSDEGESSVIWPETEELICRELIERVELLEDLLRQYQGRRFFPNVAEQLNLLRDSFMALLKNHSVDQFDLKPGTELSAETRKQIHLVSADEVGDPKLKRKSAQNSENPGRTTVLQTIRPGYVYRNGGQDVIIRKAEVVVA